MPNPIYDKYPVKSCEVMRLQKSCRRKHPGKLLSLLLALVLSLTGTAQISKLSDFGSLSSNDRIFYLFNQVHLNYTPEVALAKLDSLQHITQNLKDERALDYIRLFKF